VIIINNYTVYHLHSDLSNGVTNIDSITKYYEYIDYAKSLGMTALGFSEHGCVFEWIHKKQKIEESGMKYIHASEFYLTETLDEKIRDNYHCVLIAKNYNGVKEINKLSSTSFNRNNNQFYYAPRITFKQLYNTSENIIITSACLGGVFSNGTPKLKKEMLQFFIKNKHRCYLEIQHHNEITQCSYNQLLVKISDKYNIPLIAGTDTHALNDIHLEGRSILQKGKNVRFENEDSWDLTFKTYDELIKAYEKQNAIPSKYYLQAIENTNLMANNIETFELDYNAKYPKLYNNSIDVLKQKIINGIKNRGINKYKNFQEYKEKIQYELDTYIHNNAVDFLLLEEDYKTALKKQGVDYGYSRGSVSGSIIAYILGITDVDSIKYNLNFERFMNKERVSLADIDTDWFKEDREKVREYLYNKEGLYCCDIITFNTIAMKGAIKDIGRALGMSVDETQNISNAVTLNNKKKWVIDDNWRKKYPKLFKYVDIVTGTIVSVGNHPAGLVVSPFPIDDYFGTFTTSTNKNPISQINMKEIDGLNFVKLDILGLDCIGLINKTCKLANIPRLTPDNMDFTDVNVWNDIAKDCTMIFQFESDFAGDYLKNILKKETINKIKKVNPNFSYIDIMSMANGAIRPAGASYRNELSQGIYRDNGHKALNDFLAPTLGYLVYQEQVMEFLHLFCGFTMGEADIVRRGFAKKTGTEKFMPQIKSGFTKIMKEKYNVDKKESDILIENFIQVIKDASDYLFSKNHADPYSFLGYACAYLRYYYKLEFVTTALNIYKEDEEKSIKIINYANRNGIKINNIKFGKSLAEYTMDKATNSIYKGIASIKYCNSQIASELMELSNNEYDNFIELLDDINIKTSVNARQLEILVTLGFFSDFGKNKYLLDVVEIYNKFYNKKQFNKNKLDQLNISESLLKKYSNKETKSLYKEIDNKGLIKELSKKIENKSLDVITQIKSEIEYLGYSIYQNSNINNKYYIVISFITYNDPTKPYLILKNINTGKEIKTRIKNSKSFKSNPFGQFSILEINDFEKDFRRKKINGKWEVTDELEIILENYVVIK